MLKAFLFIILHRNQFQLFLKRTLINPEDELSRFVGEIDNGSLETMRNILESMLDNIEEQIVDEQSIIEFDKEFDPQYDDWYCP